MTDIDFDELDKAVNSLMGQEGEKQDTSSASVDTGTQQPDTQQSAQPVASTAVKSNTSSTEPEIAAKEEAVSTTPQQPTQPEAKPIVPKRRGQFMDVVHPSSDMSSTKQTIPARRGKPIAPANPTVAEAPQSHPVPPQPPIVEEDATISPIGSNNTDGQVASQQSSPDVMPDPLAIHLEKEAAKDAQVEEQSSANNLEPMAEETSADSPQSPFIPGAKVEKKPLGNAAPTTAANPEAKKEDTQDGSAELPGKVDEMPISGLEGQQAETEAKPKPLPAEFSSEILSVESDATKPHQEAEPSAEQPSQPSSIVQQYKEKPTDEGEQEHTPMYDSTTEPLAHPQKKKSGWMVVFFILLLIVLGVGGAAAVYFFDINLGIL